MLLFIGICFLLPIVPTLFQYISCYCLSFRLSCIVLAILSFQYISCYCLSYPAHLLLCTLFISIHLMLLFIVKSPTDLIKLLYFNTSHVTVYPIISPLRISSTSFQYISCYCLSRIAHNFCLLYSLFQYISCYCLSHILLTGRYNILYFNTSHVTVYRDHA